MNLTPDIEDVLKPPVNKMDFIGIIQRYSNLSPVIKAAAVISIMSTSQAQLDELAGVIMQIIQMPAEQRADLIKAIMDKINAPPDLRKLVDTYASNLPKD